MLLWFVLLSPTLAAELELSSIFHGGAVLQRGQPAAVWGSSAASSVSLALDGRHVITAPVLAGGNWTAYLPSQSAGFNHRLTVSDTSGKRVSVTVSFGDVILCSGQSNMQMPVGPITDKKHPHGTGFHALNGTAESAAADRYTNKIWMISPQNHGGWNKTEKGEVLVWNTVSSKSLFQFSAICWYTGKAHFEYLQGKVPVGLMVGSVGGSPIEWWIRKQNIAACQVDTPVCDNRPGYYNASESKFFELFIKVLQPYTVGAVIWDQGERDVHCMNPAISSRTASYACMEQQLIRDWRAGFNSSFSFVTVQLPGYLGDCDPQGTNHSSCVPGVFNMRLAQEMGVKSEGDSGVVATYDQSCDYGVRTALCPFGTVHTLDKVTVGSRVALQLRKLMFKEQVAAQGPHATSVRVQQQQSANQQFSLTVDFSAHGSLVMKGTANCKECCRSVDFDASADGIHWVNGTSVTATGSSVQFDVMLPSKPVQVRYTANQAFPQCAVYDESTLPALPFSLVVTQNNVVVI